MKKHISVLLRALKTLEPEQGRISRRNARRRVFAALKALRQEVDDTYPGVRRAPKKRRQLTPQMRARRLRASGWEVVSSMEVLSRLTAAGVRVRRVLVPGAETGGVDTYAPRWAITIASQAPSRLARSRKSIRERKATLTEIALNREGR